MVKNSKLKTQNSKRATCHLSLVTSFGFTLIELLIVIAIIGILASVFVATYPSAQKRARDTQRKSDIKQYQTAIEIYANKNNGIFPTFNGQAANFSFCGSTLSLPGCPNDPKGVNPYLVNTTSTAYVVWARLELPPSPVTYFVSCSTGEAGETATNPATVAPNCPI